MIIHPFAFSCSSSPFSAPSPNPQSTLPPSFVFPPSCHKLPYASSARMMNCYFYCYQRHPLHSSSIFVFVSAVVWYWRSVDRMTFGRWRMSTFGLNCRGAVWIERVLAPFPPWILNSLILMWCLMLTLYYFFSGRIGCFDHWWCHIHHCSSEGLPFAEVISWRVSKTLLR